MKPISKHLLYELSVQSPEWKVQYLLQFHQSLTRKKALSFREDFCGSGRIACEWVKQSGKHSALGLDFEAEPLQYASTVNQTQLSIPQQKQVSFKKQNVLKPTLKKFDLIGSFNFSHSVFHERADMLRYAKSVLKSLNAAGSFFLEVAGGPDFLKEDRHEKIIKVPGVGRVKQVWEQHQFDPITTVSDYSIHFKLPTGDWLNDAFTYHWRIWGLRELREILSEAGFKKTLILWPEGDAYHPVETAEHEPFFIAYIVALK